MPNGRARRPDPNPGEQDLPEFPPEPTAGVQKWLVEYIEVGNEEIKVIDYLVRNGVVTSERRERTLTEQEVETLYRQSTKRTFSETMDHISSLAD